MLTQMEVTSEQPGVAALPLGGFMPNNEAIQIRNIDGLGPVKADIQTTGYATGRGEMSTGASIPKRNIVLSLGLNPNWAEQSITSLRHLLYAYFMPESKVHLRFYLDELPSVYIDGVVESFEPNIFSQDPEVQISILCYKPDFIDVLATDLTGTIVSGTPEATIDYIGTISTGFTLQITTPTGSYSGDITIRNTVRGVDHDFIMNGVDVNTFDFLELSSMRTERYLRTVSASDASFVTILGKIGSDSEWPELLPGTNVISILTDAVGLHWSMTYFNRFGGL
jgi:hypothetical protein